MVNIDQSTFVKVVKVTELYLKATVNVQARI